MPFGGYTDFDECVRKNSDKKDPKAYCGTIKVAAEGRKLPTPKIEEFRAIERFDISESTFEVEEDSSGKKKLTANVRLIKSGMSKNHRNYRSSALKESVNRGIWNGVRMFANHSKTVPLQRPMNEMVAAIESTAFDEKAESVEAKVVFFNKDFYEFAERAKEYMGDSINAMVQGTRVRDGTGRVTEDIHRIVQPHSVDFVIYPAAGGMIHSFEGEGDMIDWAQITAKDIRENAAEVYAAIKAEVEADNKIDDKKPVDQPPVVGLSPEEVDRKIAEALTAREKEVTETKKKIDAVNARMVQAFQQSGLPQPVQKRLIASYEGATEFDEVAVKESITEAQEELKAVGVGPQITGQGPSGGAGEPKVPTFSIQESVEAAFGMKKAPPAKKEGDKE